MLAVPVTVVMRGGVPGTLREMNPVTLPSKSVMEKSLKSREPRFAGRSSPFASNLRAWMSKIPVRVDSDSGVRHSERVTINLFGISCRGPLPAGLLAISL